MLSTTYLSLILPKFSSLLKVASSGVGELVGQCVNRIMRLGARSPMEGCEAEKGRVLLTCSVVWNSGGWGKSGGHASLTRMWLLIQERQW